MEPDFAELESEMARQIESGLRPTLQIAVDWRGRRVFERALGPGATVDSTYVLWSSTKPFVAVALLQLVEAGQLELDTRVATVLPEFGAHGKDRITVAHLLTHRGGFPDNDAGAGERAGEALATAGTRRCASCATWSSRGSRAPTAATTRRRRGSWSASWCSGSTTARCPTRCARACSSRSAIPRDGFALGRPEDLAAPPLRGADARREGRAAAEPGRLLERPAHARAP